VATPAAVFQAYRTPLNGERLKQEKVKNLQFDELLDDVIKQYLMCHKSIRRRMIPLCLLLLKRCLC
jgi:hypothetical protein